MILTIEIMKQAKSDNNGWNMSQLRLLGIEKLKRGWMKTILGMDYPPEIITQFINLKNSHLKPEKLKKNKPPKGLSFTPVFKQLSWADQYLHPNWQKMRLYILNRDNFTCVNCKEQHSQLHVHHMKYLRNKNVWEVPTWYLVTLCDACHSEEHGRDLRS